jgi:putative ABC transport system ATP-binding protein
MAARTLPGTVPRPFAAAVVAFAAAFHNPAGVGKVVNRLGGHNLPESGRTSRQVMGRQYRGDMDSIPTSESPAGAAALVRIRDLRLTVPSAAGPVNILRGIDLDILRGEAIGLVGPSGSGKTSLLMVLAGLERPSGGSVAVDGQVITGWSEDALARLRRDRIGIVFQAFHLIPTMTALENVSVPLELAGHRSAATRARAALAAVGLSHRLTHLPGQLSGGEQQRVALARAFAPEPTLLLADEPTGNLDHATGAAVMDLLFDLRARRGTTLLLITHDRELAGRCDRQVHLSDGRIVEPVEASA